MSYARPEERIYARERGGKTRYYADFRHFREYGGVFRQEKEILKNSPRLAPTCYP